MLLLIYPKWSNCVITDNIMILMSCHHLQTIEVNHLISGIVFLLLKISIACAKNTTISASTKSYSWDSLYKY